MQKFYVTIFSIAPSYVGVSWAQGKTDNKKQTIWGMWMGIYHFRDVPRQCLDVRGGLSRREDEMFAQHTQHFPCLNFSKAFIYPSENTLCSSAQENVLR